MVTKTYTKFFINLLVLCVLAVSVQGATVAYWQLDDSDGTIDSVGTFNFTAIGTEAFSTNRFDPINNPDATTPWTGGNSTDNPSSAILSGATAYYIPNPLSTADNTFDFEPSKSFTIEGWIAPTGGTGIVIGNTQANGTGSSYKGWRIASSSTLLRFYIDGAASSSSVELTTAVVSGELIHFAGVWDATEYKMYLYVNGELRGSTSGSQAWSYSRGSELAIGARDVGAGYTSWKYSGVIDELRYSDVPLTPEEFLYIDPSPITVAYWELDGSSWDAKDAMGDHDLTLEGLIATSGIKVNPIPNPEASEQWHSTTTAASNPSSTFFSSGNQSVYHYPNPAATHNGDFDFNPGKSFTVEGWFSASSAATTWIVGTRTGTAANAYNGTWKGWDVHVGAGPALVFYIDGAAATGFSQMITAPIVLDEFTHFTAVWDSVANQMRLYINGRLKSSASGKDEWAVSRGGPLSIGGRDAGSGYNSWLFTGRIDEIRYSRKAIEPADYLNYPFCSIWGYKSADFNEDCYVNIEDFAMLANYWMAE